MPITDTVLPCGYRLIPFIVNGEENPHISSSDIERSRRAVKLMAEDCKNDRLSENYTTWLKLHTMEMYSVLWDVQRDSPVIMTGAQKMSDHCCRLFSRYYLFTNYRTDSTNTMYDKVDNFEADMYHLELMKDNYPLFFWSRDNGTNFFKRIKKVRDDVFSDWEVYPEKIELVWKDNHQGIIYTGDPMYIDELRFGE